MDVSRSGFVGFGVDASQQECRLHSASSAACLLPTPFGEFELHGWRDAASGHEHAALCMGRLGRDEPVLARVHSECLTGDALFSLRCDCGPQLRGAMEAIAAQGRGVLVYLRQEGRGIGLVNKIRAYALQQAGADTVDANRLLGLPDDTRNYRAARDIFTSLGIRRVRLMTNNPAKVHALQQLGIEVVERVPLQLGRNRHNEGYLDTKHRRLGHWLDDEGVAQSPGTQRPADVGDAREWQKVPLK